MGLNQGVIYDQRGVYLTGTYHGDSDLQLLWMNANNDSLEYLWIKSNKWFHQFGNQIKISI